MRPVCRWCGKSISKKTHRHYHALPDDATISTAQLVTNEHVIGLLRAVKGSGFERSARARQKRGDGWRIIGFVTWDEKSYVNPYFCKGVCAQAFAMDRAAKEVAP